MARQSCSCHDACRSFDNVLPSKTVTATASSKDKLDWLLGIPNGATHAVNYKTQDFAAEVKTATDGHGADVVIDFVGQTHWQKNIDSLAKDGRMTILSFLSGKLFLLHSFFPTDSNFALRFHGFDGRPRSYPL
jgi:NADPH:quinone reductase-like Zn-dependent oxidoreductase